MSANNCREIIYNTSHTTSAAWLYTPNICTPLSFHSNGETPCTALCIQHSDWVIHCINYYYSLGSRNDVSLKRRYNHWNFSNISSRLRNITSNGLTSGLMATDCISGYDIQYIRLIHHSLHGVTKIKVESYEFLRHLEYLTHSNSIVSTSGFRPSYFLDFRFYILDIRMQCVIYFCI